MAYTDIGGVDGSRVQRVEEGIYLVRLVGHLSVKASNELTEIVRRDSPKGPRAILYETTKDFTGYDPDLRKTNSAAMVQGTSHIGIITSSALLRMVTATIAIGLRVAFNIPMASYSTVDSGIEGARVALRKAG